MTVLHFSVQMSHIKFPVPSSHCSPFSLIPFQQMDFDFLQSNQHIQSLPFSSQLSHSSYGLLTFQSQQICKHFVQRSTGQLVQVSPRSITPFQHSGLRGSFLTHITVQLLSIVQFLSQSSHCSVHSGSHQFQHFWFGLTDLQSGPHSQSVPLLFDQLSHCSPGSTIPLPQDQVHFHTSLWQ